MTTQTFRAAHEGGYILNARGEFVAQAIICEADYPHDQARETARIDAAGQLATLLNAGQAVASADGDA
jgi:hypothetical protein